MAKVIIKTGVAARDELIKGANILGDAIKSTLGPYGTNAYLEKGDKVTNDGKTIAQEFWHPNEIMNRGMNLLRKAGIATDEKIGDFTTTAITLAQAILKSAVKFLPTEKRVIGSMTPSEVLQKIEQEYEEINASLIGMATPITSKEQLVEAATVSVENKELGKLIGEAQFALGKNGVLIAEESNDATSSVKMVNGIRIDNGYSSKLLAFDPATQTLTTGNTKTLLTNHVIQSLVPLAPLLKSLTQQKVGSLAIIARAFSGEALKECVKYMEAGFPIYPINAPYTDQNEVMKDIIAIFGGRYIHTENADLADVQVSDVGYAEQIVCRSWDSILTGIADPTSEARVKGRITELEKHLKVSESDFLKIPLMAIYEQITSSAPKEFVIPEWVKDSVKGLQVALKEACDVAGVFATTLIASAQENPKPKYVQETAQAEEVNN